MPAAGDVLWTVVSFILTLLVFSYLLGDNRFFRFVSAIFIGVTAGYLFVIIVYQVILARLIAPLAQGTLVTLIPVLLSGLLLMKLSPRLAPLGNPSMALLVGVGAAVAVGGAVLGTIFGQIKGALAVFYPSSNSDVPPAILMIEGAFFLLGTLTTLAYFHFGAKKKDGTSAKRAPIVNVFSGVGQFFIAITLGAVFAGVLTSAITALVERVDFVVGTLLRLVQ